MAANMVMTTSFMILLSPPTQGIYTCVCPFPRCSSRVGGGISLHVCRVPAFGVDLVDGFLDFREYTTDH